MRICGGYRRRLQLKGGLGYIPSVRGRKGGRRARQREGGCRGQAQLILRRGDQPGLCLCLCLGNLARDQDLSLLKLLQLLGELQLLLLQLLLLLLLRQYPLPCLLLQLL